VVVDQYGIFIIIVHSNTLLFSFNNPTSYAKIVCYSQRLEPD